MANILKPDEILAKLEEQLKKAPEHQRPAILEQINKRQQEVFKASGYTNVGFGAGGYFIPGDGQGIGLEVLEPTGTPGVYQKSVITSDTSVDQYGRKSVGIEGNKRTFYDANGNPLTPAQVAKTAAGQSFVAAGWDIGFGAGVLPQGTEIITKGASTGNRLGMGSNVNVGSSTGLTATDVATQARRSAQQEFRAALNEMGLADLADTVDEMIRQDYTTAQIRLELPKTQAYALRFPGMEALRKAGRAISEAVYISNEKGYLQTLRAYGLDAAILGSRSELGKYIANEVSPREFEERVSTAATRVKENPDVIAAFKSYYPEADEGGIIAYLLNPKAGMDIIKKQVRVSEIGAAATKAGFARDLVGANMAESLISAVGDTGYAQIATEFQRARQLANNQRRLAQIEGQQYTDLEAISAVVGDDVTSALASQRRAEREAARFGGAGGVSGASLRSTTAI